MDYPKSVPGSGLVNGLRVMTEVSGDCFFLQRKLKTVSKGKWVCAVFSFGCSFS